MQHYDTLLLKPSIRDLNRELQDGNVLMKIFSGWQPQAWSGFIEQLKNPKKRASLRQPVPNHKDKPSHKFHHLTGEIKPYSKGETVKPHHQTHAKKQSTTLISPEKCTPLFQSHQSGTLLVGVVLRADPNMEPGLYDPARAKIKAMLGADAGTYGRQWRGTEATVKAYAQNAENYKSLEEFKEIIRHNATQYNEVLAEPSKESLIGIVIGRDTPKARKLARQYQNDIQTKLDIKLPIVLYDAKRRMLIEDLELYERFNVRRDLLAEKERLLNIAPVTQPSFFRRYKTYQGKQYPADVVTQFNKIDNQFVEMIRFYHLPQDTVCDNNRASLLAWAKKMNNQALLDDFYRLGIENNAVWLRTDNTETEASIKNKVLHWAIHCHQSTNTISRLISQGADINAVVSGGCDALHLASEQGQAAIAELLITEYHADINSCSGLGATPILLAIEHGHQDVVDVLLKHNADVSIPLRNSGLYHAQFKVEAGDTPLQAAIKLDRKYMVKKLLAKGAAVNVIAGDYENPLQVAAVADKLKLLQYAIKVNRREDNHYKKSFTLFNRTLNFGYSAKHKKDAVTALNNVLFNSADKSILDAHKKVLNNGELGSIYQGLSIE